MIALTGGSGFLGTTLLRALGKDRVRILGRSKLNNYEGNFAQIELNSSADYTQALKGVDVVIHLAARAHIMNDIAEDPLAIYRETNTAGTLNLARQASKSGVKRFIFISSIKVNGESTHLGSPFKNDDLAAPEDPYGVSKMEAEYGLLQLAADGIKLFTKEDFVPQNAVKPIFMIAPIITAATAFIAMTAIPFFPEFELFGYTVRPIISDVNVGILFVMGVASIGLYGPLLAGMSSANKWGLLGGARTAIQLLSYEVVSGLALLAPLMMVGSLSLIDLNNFTLSNKKNC